MSNARRKGHNEVRVTVQSLSFELNCTDGVKLIEDLAMRFQLQVDIKEQTKQESLRHHFHYLSLNDSIAGG